MEKLNTLTNTAEDNEFSSMLPEDSPETEEKEEVEKVCFGRTKDGVLVYDREDSHFHGESGLTPKILSEALSKIDTDGKSFVLEQIDLGREIGKQTCVEIGPDDDVTMVFRKNRSGRSPMVKNREATPCNSVVVIMCKDPSIPDKNALVLVTSYIGELAPKEPWDPSITTEEERRACQEYWETHALLYNEELIDQERTQEFNEMTDEEKRAELIKERTLYAGLFVNPEELYGKIEPKLGEVISTPHVTTSFKPGVEELHLDQIGSGARIIAIGYGNDGKNEGLLVRVEAEEPAIQKACDERPTPHITLSISREGAHAKDTAFLDFKPLEKPFEITGTYGLFSHGSVLKSKEDLNTLENLK